jgi:hypothetical protein
MADPITQPQRQGLLGGFFGPQGRDTRQRLALALEGMTQNPNQALIGQIQTDIQGREEQRQKNASLEWLRSRGRNDLADAVLGGLPIAEAITIASTPADPSYRQITGAQLGLIGPDAEKLFNMSPDGQVTAIGGAGTTVNVDTGAGSKFEEEFAKLDAKSLADISVTGNQAVRNLGRIDQLESILASAPQGMEGAIKLAAGEFGINTEGLSDIQAAEAVISSLVPEQRAPGSGSMSDADLALFKRSLPRIINQPGGNAIIINTMRAIAQYDAEGAAIAQRFRAGEIDRAKAFELLQSRQNPLANFRAPAATEGSGGPTTVRTFNPATGQLE